ncbi:hypothetical protein JYT31_00985 [Beggiatoa alba]|nr:hypothetical protein [Beggiatoa alba]
MSYLKSQRIYFILPIIAGLLFVTSSFAGELKVQAVGNAQKAAPGNYQPASLLITVTKSGMPIDGLVQNNFTIRPLIRPNMDDLRILIVCDYYPKFSALGDGAYLFRPVSDNGCGWSAGDYNFQILVRHGSEGKRVSITDQGQALATVSVR